MKTAALFHAMACNNAWANHQLLGACEGLSQEAFAAERTGFFPSIRLTLVHILEVDRFYIDALEGGGQGRSVYELPPPQTLAELRTQQSCSDARLIAFCAGLGDAALEAAVTLAREDGPRADTVGRVLLHLFQHQIHHRGQAHAMLAETDVKPPQLDEFFLAEDEAIRRDAFAQLGWEETDIWPPD